MTFTPDRIPIANISQANPAIVTTTIPHNLTTGQVVRINCPQGWGMIQINKTMNIITVLSANTFSLQQTQVPVAVNVNSTNYAAFTTPSKPQFTAEVLPMGAGPTPNLSTPTSILNNQCQDELDDAVFNNSTAPIPF